MPYRTLIVLLAATLLAAMPQAALTPDALARLRFCTELSAPPKGAAPTACMWKKKTVTVRFLEGVPAVQNKVQKIALEWNAYSGVQLAFINAGTADIRIGFKSDGGSNSYVGTCRPALADSDQTMNFGWLTPGTDDVEYQRVVLHEFGHALGLVHEHQNPASPIKWNKQAAYDYYARTDKWDRATVERNLFDKYNEAETRYSAFDSSSIMAYYIPKELTTNHVELGRWNSTLSATDKTFIAQMYPR